MAEDDVFPAFPEVVDSTMRASMVACHRQFWYGHILGLRKSGTSIHLHFGGAVAHALEATRTAFYRDGADEITAVGRGLTACVRFWGDFEIPDDIANSRAGVKTLDAALDAILSYFETYPLAHDQLKPVMVAGEPLVERSCALPLEDTRHPVTGNPIIYAGRFDMLGQFNDAVFVVDEKTASSLGSMWRSNWNLRGQLTGYCWLARSFGLPIAGAVIRGIGVLKGSITFEQALVTRPDWMVERWRDQIVRDINRAAAVWLEARDRWASAPHLAWDQALDGACTAYGGCGYVPLCETPDPRVWYADYVVSHWDPLRRPGDEVAA